MREHDLDVVKYNGTCVRRKKRIRCDSGSCRCLYEYRYFHYGFPCPCFLADNRGFDGELGDIPGERLRRSLFFFPCAGALSFVFFTLLYFIGISLTDMRAAYDSRGIFRIAGLSLVLALIFLALHIVFSRFAGRVVCVVNKSGLYFNRRRLAWDDVSSIRLCIRPPRGFSRFSPLPLCSAFIVSGFEEFHLPHMSPRLLFLVKKYAPYVDSGVEWQSAVLMTVLYVAAPAALSAAVVL